MPWAVAAAAVAAGGAIYSANKASHSADHAESIEQQKQDLANRDDQRSGQLFDRYMSLYGPAQKKVLRTAEKGLFNPKQEAARAVAGVERSAEQNAQVRERNATRLGVNPNSGRFQALAHDDAINTAAAEAGAANNARRSAVLNNFNVLNQASQEGNALIGQSSQYAGMAGAGLADVGDYYGRQADAYNRASAGYGAVAGAGLADLGDYFRNQQQPQKPPAQTDLISGDFDEAPYNSGTMIS